MVHVEGIFLVCRNEHSKAVKQQIAGKIEVLLLIRGIQMCQAVALAFILQKFKCYLQTML